MPASWAAGAAIAALFLTLLNFFKGSSDWLQQFRTKRNERRIDSVQLQVNAWKELVTAGEKRIDLLEQRVTIAEGKLEACEEERDELYKRYILKEKKPNEGGRRSGDGP